MKLTVLQEDLQKALAVASRNVASRPQLPVLSHLLLVVSNGRLKISATDLETGVNLWIGAKVEEEGAIALPARIITEYVSMLPAGQLSLEVKEGVLRLETPTSQASFNGMAASEFPKIPSAQGEAVLEIPKNIFVQAVHQVAFAAATDDARPVLTGIYLFVKDKKLQMVATDGYRLSFKALSDSLTGDLAESFKDGLIVPARAFLETAKISGEEVESIRLYYLAEASQLVFVAEKTEVVSRLIEGQFPDFEKIIPTETALKVSLDTEELQRAVKMASIFARENANIVKLSFGENQVEVAANTSQVGENKTQVESQCEGKGEPIAFNSRYLMDFLGVVESERLNFEMKDALKPGAFRAAGDDSFLHIIMPVRVQE